MAPELEQVFHLRGATAVGGDLAKAIGGGNEVVIGVIGGEYATAVPVMEQALDFAETLACAAELVTATATLARARARAYVGVYHVALQRNDRARRVAACLGELAARRIAARRALLLEWSVVAEVRRCVFE
jgi:hypothetical protein